MNFTNFTNSPQANQFLSLLCFQVIDFCNSQLPEPLTWERYFGLSGRGAAILQGEEDNTLSNIVFVCNDLAIMNFIRYQLAKKTNSPAVHFANRSVFYHPNIVCEFWFISGGITFLSISGYNVQSLLEIPTETL